MFTRQRPSETHPLERFLHRLQRNAFEPPLSPPRRTQPSPGPVPLMAGFEGTTEASYIVSQFAGGVSLTVALFNMNTGRALGRDAGVLNDCVHKLNGNTESLERTFLPGTRKELLKP
jgi:hypothetical protein